MRTFLDKSTIRKGSIKEFFGADPSLKICIEMRSGLMIDVSGTGNHLTNSSAIFKPRAFGLGFDYNGGSYYSQNASPGLGTGSDWTHFIWAIPTGSAGSYAALSGLNSGSGTEWYLFRATDNKSFSFRRTGSTVITSPATYLNDQLVFIAIVSNSVANTTCMFINGALVGSTTATALGTQPYRIGNYYSSSYAFQGWLGENGMFLKAISSKMIGQYYNWSMAISKRRGFIAITAPLVTNGFSTLHKLRMSRRAA